MLNLIFGGDLNVPLNGQKVSSREAGTRVHCEFEIRWP
jgi:hypothetical protein